MNRYCWIRIKNEDAILKLSMKLLAIIILLLSIMVGCGDDGGSSPEMGPVPEVPLPEETFHYLGIAFGAYYQGQDYGAVMNDLGIKYTYVNAWWDNIEQLQGTYDFNVIDHFINQLRTDTIPLLRITARNNEWGTIDQKHSVPASLGVGSDYYNYIYNVVQRTEGKIIYLENDWEVNYSEHWGGSPADYADLTRTFYKAAKAANPDAVIIMGGAGGSLDRDSQSFFNEVFLNLANDQLESSFDKLDVHLYANLYDIPERIQWFRDAMDMYPEHKDKPIVVTEYGGPSPQEFAEKYPDEFKNFMTEISQDLCILSGDLKNTSLEPEGYPDALRMFAYGIEKELDEKRDRIQGRQMVQRTLLAYSEGVESMFWWNLETDEPRSDAPCYVRHPVFGKMSLMTEGPKGTFTPKPTYYYYQTMIDILGDTLKSVERIQTSDANMYLFKIIRYDDSTLYVVWERRDQFEGEELPPVQFIFNVPWSTVKIVDLFGHSQNQPVVNGEVTIDITDTPVFIEENI